MRIGEVARASGTTSKTLRYYEEVGLLPAADRTPAGYRDYGAEVLDRLDFIRRGQAAGLTLAQIGQVLDIRDRGQAPCRHVTDLLDTRLDVIDRQLAELAQLRTTIAILREHATTGDPATPYSWAEALAAQLDSGVLVTREGEGHTAYGRSGGCIEDLVDAYLLEDEVPAEGATC